MRVLYVDDDPSIREVAVMALELDSTLEVRACASGAEALDVAPDYGPKLILLDVMMPQMDGPTTLSHLRADPRTAGIPVVFITARTQSADVERLQALGALGVIPKPFDPMTLADQARAFLPKSDPFDALAKRFRIRALGDAEQLRRALAASDRAMVEAISHALSGAAGTFGFAHISEHAAALELAAETGGDGWADAARPLLAALASI